MDNLGFYALTPLWLRLIGIYCLLGLTLSHYQKLRDAGESRASAIGGVILAAVMTPVTAVKLIIAYYRTPKDA